MDIEEALRVISEDLALEPDQDNLLPIQEAARTLAARVRELEKDAESLWEDVKAADSAREVQAARAQAAEAEVRRLRDELYEINRILWLVTDAAGGKVKISKPPPHVTTARMRISKQHKPDTDEWVVSAALKAEEQDIANANTKAPRIEDIG